MNFNYDPGKAHDTELALLIPEHLTTAVLMIALDFKEILGNVFSAEVDIEDNRILYNHPVLHRAVQLRWHDGEPVAFLGEFNGNELIGDRPGYRVRLATLRGYCDDNGIKIEAEYPYPFDGPFKGKLTGIGAMPPTA